MAPTACPLWTGVEAGDLRPLLLLSLHAFSFLPPPFLCFLAPISVDQGFPHSVGPGWKEPLCLVMELLLKCLAPSQEDECLGTTVRLWDLLAAAGPAAQPEDRARERAPAYTRALGSPALGAFQVSPSPWL